jgi:hypothetical protein
MQDRDYHELGDQDLRDRLERQRRVNLPEGAKELPQPGSIKGEVTNLQEPVTEADTPVRQGAAIGGLTIAPPTVSFVQLPDGRQQYIVELRQGDYEKLVMADRPAVLDFIVNAIRTGLAKLWSLPTA